jgi:hypothetical protein
MANDTEVFTEFRPNVVPNGRIDYAIVNEYYRLRRGATFLVIQLRSSDLNKGTRAGCNGPRRLWLCLVAKAHHYKQHGPEENPAKFTHRYFRGPSKERGGKRYSTHCVASARQRISWGSLALARTHEIYFTDPDKIAETSVSKRGSPRRGSR